jgi:hypothetical protein
MELQNSSLRRYILGFCLIVSLVGCSQVDDNSLVQQAEARLLKNGFLWQCTGTFFWPREKFDSLQSFSKVSEKKYKVTLKYREKIKKSDVAIKEIKIFRAYSTPVFAECVAKRWSLSGRNAIAKRIESGKFKAIALLGVRDENSESGAFTHYVTCVFEKSETGGYQWEFHPEDTSEYHALWRAFSSAYENETNPDFRRCIGK